MRSFLYIFIILGQAQFLPVILPTFRFFVTCWPFGVPDTSPSVFAETRHGVNGRSPSSSLPPQGRAMTLDGQYNF